MPIAINGSGSITGISVGGIPDGVVDTDVLANNAVTLGKIGTTEQSQLCKAWVNFNGTGTVAIRASYNVSSITDNGTGDYTVNFTTALVDTNYSALGTPGGTTSAWLVRDYSDVTSRSASAIRFATANTAGSPLDPSIVNIAIFR